MERNPGSVNIQDSYLGRACRERAWLTVQLNGGKRLTGRIRSFDRYTLILEDRGVEQMIFKHAIATISTSRAFSNAIQLGDAKDRKPQSRAQRSERDARTSPGDPEGSGGAAGTPESSAGPGEGDPR